MTRLEFEKEISNIQNYYIVELSYDEKEKWYQSLCNLPLETVLKAKLELFRTSDSICTLNKFISLCEHNFNVKTTTLINYMKENNFFLNEEIEKKVKYYIRKKNIPMWLKRNMEIQKKMYFKELIGKVYK